MTFAATLFRAELRAAVAQAQAAERAAPPRASPSAGVTSPRQRQPAAPRADARFPLLEIVR